MHFRCTLAVTSKLEMMDLLNNIYKHYSENPWELLTLLVALSSLGVAVMTRVHSNRLFRSNVLANFEFDLVVDRETDILLNGNYSDVRTNSLRVSDLPLIVVSWRNTTEKRASNLRAEFLIKANNRIASWCESLNDWKMIQGNESQRDVIGNGIASALKSDSIEIRESTGSLRELTGPNPCLVFLVEQERKLNVEVYVKFVWESPTEKPLKKSALFRLNIQPTNFDGRVATEWGFQKRKINKFRLFILRLMNKIKN